MEFSLTSNNSSVIFKVSDEHCTDEEGCCDCHAKDMTPPSTIAVDHELADENCGRFYQHFYSMLDPKSVKMIDDLIVIFVCFRSTRVKAACKMLMKLTPDGNSVNEIREKLMY